LVATGSAPTPWQPSDRVLSKSDLELPAQLAGRTDRGSICTVAVIPAARTTPSGT
jgi:hypothetical protein